MSSSAPSMQALQALRHEIAARGWTRKATGRILFQLLLNLTMFAVGAVVFVTSPQLVLRAAALVLVTAGSMGVATNTHTASHYATSRKKSVNEALTYFGYPFFLGLSATFWWHQHVSVHHTAPNVIGVDDDADLGPWLARTREQICDSSGLRRIYYQHLQWLALPVLLSLNAFGMTTTGWMYLLRQLLDGRRRTSKHWFDLAAMLLHYGCFLVAPALFLGVTPVIALYMLRMVLLGYLMFAILAPGHFPAEAICVRGRPGESSYVRLQTAATVNFRVGWVGRLLCSGLQYQIEHHLFPGISHVYYPKLSMLLRDFCRQYGLPYRSYQWDHALYKCVATFRRPPATLAYVDSFFESTGLAASATVTAPGQGTP